MATKKPTTKKPTTKRTKPIVENKKKAEPLAIDTIGDTDMFEVLNSFRDPNEGFERALLAKQVRGGCLVAVTTRQRNPDGSHAVSDALAFVPNVTIGPDINGGKKLSQPRM
tara:strand:+ start:2774 stop:3106 length:333 start_codon:yes stop_codon:yes gene_type:complete